jgi:hypothetical protein
MRDTRIAQHAVQRQADLAGTPVIPHLVTAAPGTLYRPARVECRGDVLTYELAFDPRNAIKSPTTFLFDFLVLAEAPAAEIAKFAARFAVLGLCWDHRLPFGHRARITLGELYQKGPSGPCNALFRAATAGRYKERAQDWRTWARRFRSVFELANALKQGTLSAPLLDERFLLGYSSDSIDAIGSAKNKSLLWGQLTRVLNTWLQDAGLTLIVTNKGNGPEIHLSNTTYFAFPVLALQLVLYVNGAKEVSTCSACGGFYLPDRRPPAGRNHYCQECGKKAANRVAIRRFRERQRAADTVKGERHGTHSKQRDAGGTK